MKIAIVTAIWKRYDVFKIFAENIKKFPVEVVVAGSEPTAEEWVNRYGFHYVFAPNQPLADKHNAALKKARELGVDYVIMMGSDDLISQELFDYYKEEISQGTDMLGFLDFYFYNLADGKALYWGGYNDSRAGRVAGPGVLFSKRVLDMWNWKLWSKLHNNVLDDSVHSKFLMTPCKKKTVRLKDLGILAVDLKSTVNMTKFEKWENSDFIDPTELREKFNLPIGNDISEHAFVDPSVIMGDGNVIMEGAIVRAGVVLKDKNYIGPYCIIGDVPEKKGYFNKPFGVSIGSNNRFTKQVTIDSGTERKTQIGDNNLFLKNSHLGHDAIVENDNTFSCNSTIGGWCEVGNNCNFGLNSSVHQRKEIPEGTMVGMGGVVTKSTELKPFRKYAGVPVKDIGSNVRDSVND